MKIIEFIGPNGIGKTHLTDFLLKSGEFIVQHDLPFFKRLPMLFFSFVILSEKTALRLLIRKIKTLANMYHIHYFNNFETSLESEKIFSEYVKDLSDYTNEGNALYFYRRIGLMIRTLTIWDLATKFNTIKPDYNKHILFDEGLAQRAISLASHGVDIHRIKKYLQNVPKPDILVCLHAPEEVIMKRRKNRASDEGSADEILFLTRIVDECKKIYQDSGVKVINLDATNSNSMNSKEIYKILNYD